MKRSLWCAALAALLGCGAWAGLVRADGPYPRTHPGAQELPPGVPPLDNTPTHHPFIEWAKHRRPAICWSSFNGFGCSSARSECAFFFGSCRTFFGEPCLAGPPPSALPPWSGQTPPYVSIDYIVPRSGLGSGLGSGSGPGSCPFCR
jgi:hypothetical protein